MQNASTGSIARWACNCATNHQSGRSRRGCGRGSASTTSNGEWAIDFLHDQLYAGRQIRILTVIDAFTRYVSAIEVRERFTGAGVVVREELASL